MANYDIPANPVYDDAIRKLENTDPGDAEVIFNPLFQKLVGNTHAVKQFLSAHVKALTGYELSAVSATYAGLPDPAGYQAGETCLVQGDETDGNKSVVYEAVLSGGVWSWQKVGEVPKIAEQLEGYVPLAEGQAKAQGASWGQMRERYLGRVGFPGGVANQKIDVVLKDAAGSPSWIEITVTSGYNGQNAQGRMTKRISSIGQSTGDIISQRSEYVCADAYISDNFAISDLKARGTQLYVTVEHRTSTGNTASIFARASDPSDKSLDVSKWTLSEVYDDDPAAMPAPSVRVPRMELGREGASPYFREVVLLHKYKDDGATAPFGGGKCVGRFVFSRRGDNAGNRMYVVDVATQSGFGGNTYRANVVNSYNDTEPAKFATCTYGGQKYLCLVMPYSNANNLERYFEGSFETQSTHPHAMKVVPYYNAQTNAVLDAEVNGSLTVLRDIYDNNYDSGWLDMVLLNGATNGPGTPLKYRKLGTVVFIKGRVSTNSTTGIVVANLPAGFRPKGSNHMFLAMLDNTSKRDADRHCFISEGGNLQINHNTNGAANDVLIVETSFIADQ